MRLNDFADPSDFIPIIADVEDLLRHLERIWPNADLEFVLAADHQERETFQPPTNHA
jgi:hypothetical protein